MAITAHTIATQSLNRVVYRGSINTNALIHKQMTKKIDKHEHFAQYSINVKDGRYLMIFKHLKQFIVYLKNQLEIYFAYKVNPKMKLGKLMN